MTALSASGDARKPVAWPGRLDILLLSAWCGLVAGWLEVGTRVFCRAVHPAGRLYYLSRHYVWLVPLADLLLFSVVGLLLAIAVPAWRRPARWLGPRVLFALGLLPVFQIAVPQIYGWAWLLVASGIAMRLVPWLERSWPRSRRWLTRSLPGLLGLVPVVAGLVLGSEWLAQRREAGTPLPPAGSPNILLVVLDTVRADHLSLYGYFRPTSRALEALARRGVRFDEARPTAPWTLASHASMFTGRWPHELGVAWVTPLRRKFRTLAGFLGSSGYATAGFVGNTGYCSYETGLDQGFTHYEDYALDLRQLRPLRTALLVEQAWTGVSVAGMALAQIFPTARFFPWVKTLAAGERNNAALVNHEFLTWLSHRPEPRRPFFAFLNYFDAHTPYLPPEGAGFRFGVRPRTLDDFTLLADLYNTIDRSRLAPRYRELIRDSYDNCLAYLDDRLGELFDALQHRGVLEGTLVIVTADHGEQLGARGLWEHGESLYRAEVRVPLVIVPPSGRQSPGVVQETVSLRDLPATIVDLAGLKDAPFPGRSLARIRHQSAAAAKDGDGPREDEGAISELESPNPANPSRGLSPAVRGPLIALAAGDHVYIRNTGDGQEQLFNERVDPDERFDRAADPAMQPVLEQLRRQLETMIAPRQSAQRGALAARARSASGDGSRLAASARTCETCSW